MCIMKGGARKDMAYRVSSGYVLEDIEDYNSVFKLSSESPYKKLKRQHKIVSRRCSDVILELEDDYAAAAWAVTDYGKKNEGIVYTPTLVRHPDIFSTKLKVGYILVRKDGSYFYPYELLRELLIKSERPKGGLQFLSGWREEKEIQRKNIDEMVQIYKNGEYI